MKSCFPLISLCLGMAFTATAPADEAVDWSGVQGEVKAWHAKAAPAGEKTESRLRVVYFHGKDRAPLPDYQGRLTRVMNDISDFYRDGMKRYGITNEGLPLERNADGSLLLHMVEGQKDSAQYNYASGGETEAEIRKALAGKVDLDREFVLVLYGQCWEIPDGRWGFYSPYYGKVGSCQRWGFCHAADCPVLDPLLLKETGKRFKYWEHYGDRDQTVAQFNSFYLGGIAHELGHGLGLPHECESPVEKKETGISLMGGGNLTYRQDLWMPRAKASFLTTASAVRLVSHPLVTGSQAGRFEETEGDFEALEASGSSRKLTVKGKITGKIPAYAVIAFIDPPGHSDYDARTWSVPVKEGSFALMDMELSPTFGNVRLTACFMNGATTTIGADFTVPGTFVQALNRSRLNGIEAAVARAIPEAAGMVERAKRIANMDGDWQKSIALLDRWVRPAAPLADLEKTGLDSCYLSDAVWREAKSGWAGTPRDRWGAPPEYGQGLFLRIAGELQDKGLPAHCPASHVFNTAGRWKKFQATAGLRDGAGAGARAIFIVKGDGKELYRSAQLPEGKIASVDIDITGVKELSLETESGMEHSHTCWAVWGMPVVKK
ncbi:NPCBM/NEW2 domain-containing protein [Luteolibacter sp. Populi]|uniref:NPCBM/NEW2 domain-containing protein n=1 Tax=Luteolibacter sp. Populi TaxID=3230487 RepID=UPI00346531FC